MTDALRYEWTRIRTLRSTYWLIGLGLLVTAGIGVIIGIADDDPDTDSVMAMLTGAANLSGAPFIAVFLGIVGIFATGHEYRHGVIQPTLTTIPQRSRMLLAKITILLAVSFAVVAVSLVLNTLIAMIFWGELPGLSDSPLNEALPGYVVFTLLYALLGLSLAQLFRGVPSAIVVIFVVPLVVESLVIGLSNVPALDWLIPAVKFLPFSSGALLMTTSEPDFGPGAPDYDFFDRWASGGIFAAFIAIILAVAWYLFKKRDA